MRLATLVLGVALSTTVTAGLKEDFNAKLKFNTVMCESTYKEVPQGCEFEVYSRAINFLAACKEYYAKVPNKQQVANHCVTLYIQQSFTTALGQPPLKDPI